VGCQLGSKAQIHFVNSKGFWEQYQKGNQISTCDIVLRFSSVDYFPPETSVIEHVIRDILLRIYGGPTSFELGYFSMAVFLLFGNICIILLFKYSNKYIDCDPALFTKITLQHYQLPTTFNFLVPITKTGFYFLHFFK
jgi:hypothetical protein